MDGVCISDDDTQTTSAPNDLREEVAVPRHEEQDVVLENVASSEDERSPEIVRGLVKSQGKKPIELPVLNEGIDRSADNVSDSDDSLIFCSDPEISSLPGFVDKPKDILAEVSDILMSLSDDQRFVECINYSSGKKPMLNGDLDKHRSSVDLIFTYNVLGVLYNKLRELKNFFELLKSENNELLQKNQIIEAEHLAYQVQVDSLQTVVDEQNEKIQSLSSQLEAEIQKCVKEKQQYASELKLARKKIEEVVHEKDAAVMRYAKNESELINIRKEKENLLKRLKTVENERDDLAKKCTSLNAAKTSVSQSLDSKKSELNAALKDIEKLKEESNYKDIKMKWIEENLQKDLNRHKEENALLLAEIHELKKETSDSSIKKHKNDQCAADTNEIKSVEFVLCDDETETNERIVNGSTVQELELLRLEYEENMNLKDAILLEQSRELQELRSNLKIVQDKLELCRGEIDQLKETNDELRHDMETCREREAEMLNFTEKLTAKNVVLQSDYAILEAKKIALEADRAPIEERIKELEDKVTSLSQLLQEEIAAHSEDIRALKEQVENKTKEVDVLNSKLEEQEAENQSLKHKYSSTIRAHTKEMQQYRKCKQLDTVEYASSSDSVCLDSRTSSCSSLNEPLQLPKLEPDRQTLIERIVKLQKLNAKNSEKIEFLEEHITQLLAEIKKKNRVLQHYILREQSGVLSSDSMDQHKAELSKYGGIMAALYNPKGDNNSLSLELSLEINRKLQAVLEDTILKNITLKDSIETLGKEIEKLTNVKASKGN